MGQYWKIVNPDKGEQLERTGRQMVHCYQYDSLHIATCLLLQGEWCGDRVVLVGDYTSLRSEPIFADLDGNTVSLTLYEAASEMFENKDPGIDPSTVTKADLWEFCDKLHANQVIADMDNKQYLRIGDYFKRETSIRETDALIEHPVPLLLAAPGDDGGGDYPYRDDFGYGLFSGHRVGIYGDDDDCLIGMDDITERVSFDEDEIRHNKRNFVYTNLPVASAINI